MNMADYTIVFFDLETTGISTMYDKIVQFAGIKVSPDGSRETYTTLINPGRPIPADASAIHGITDAMVADQPMFGDIASQINERMSGCVIAWYNSNSFDVPLLSAELERCNITRPKSDSLLIDMLTIERKLTSHKLTETYKRYTGQELTNAHDALNDTQATLEVFEHQLKKLWHIESIDDLTQRCNDGVERYDIAGKMYIKDSVVYRNFGKHRHKPIEKDLEYCNRVMMQDFPSQTKAKLKTYIESWISQNT